MKDLKEQLNQAKTDLGLGQNTKTENNKPESSEDIDLQADMKKCPECGLIVANSKFKKHFFKEHGVGAAKKAYQPNNSVDKDKRKTKKALKQAYKKRINNLCLRVQKGDDKAEKELQKEMEDSKLAVKIVQIWLRRNKQKNDPTASSSKIRTKRSIRYGNAFKPFQGGSPGMGRHS